jgi:hypothetical protein
MYSLVSKLLQVVVLTTFSALYLLISKFYKTLCNRRLSSFKPIQTMADKLYGRQLAEFKEAFSILENKKSGLINKKDLKRMSNKQILTSSRFALDVCIRYRRRDNKYY